jgi:hypothetical protein
VPLCPPQIPHGQTLYRTRTSAVGGRRLTAWAMARPCGTYLGRRIFLSCKGHVSFYRMTYLKLHHNGKSYILYLTVEAWPRG